MSRHLMLVPSLACPASCSYCFGPHEGGAPMRRETVEATVRWQNDLDDDGPLEIVFHGGEPLAAGAEYYRTALPLLRDGLAPRRVRLSMQTNLWLLTDELCHLLRAYNVSVGTSLDGPEEINDAQRGQGYYARTMAGIERARAHGLSVGCICTFTAQSAPHAAEVFDFFVHEGLSFSIHTAVPSIRYRQPQPWVLSPKVYGQLLVDLLDRYLDNLDKIRASTLDALARSVSTRKGGTCIHGDCLGGYLAVDPEGDIYPCQRFAGQKAYRLGNVHEGPTMGALSASPVWRAFREREEQIERECTDCPYLDICRGGCPYNVLAANGGSLDKTLRDPYCAAYRRIYETITDRAVDEVFAQENMDDVVSRPDPDAGLLRKGRLLSIMRDDGHPYQAAQHARRILAAVALAETRSPSQAARQFERLGLTGNARRTERGMQALYEQLNTPATRLNNLYLHVTFACPLQCSHCYAQAGVSDKGALSVCDTTQACQEAAELGFRHAVITGGEPLVHPQRDALLDALRERRQPLKPLLTVLRTSLAVAMDGDLLRRVGQSTDEVVVSVDGDRDTHDRRRGAGSYDRTVANLRALVEMGYDTDLSLAAVLPLEEANGAPGEAVRALAKELGIRRTRFRPLLPLGRAVDSELEIVPETLWGHVDPSDMVAYGFTPVAACGIGQNLYVEPDGGAYPCYAWHGEAWRLGSTNREAGLSGVIRSAAFRDLAQHTVNSNHRCRLCALRYLCGGACRAWSRLIQDEQTDLDAPPLDCLHLHARARSLLSSALGHLKVSTDQWLAAGLPLPAAPPRV